MKCKCGCDTFKYVGDLKLKRFPFSYYKCVKCGNEILVDEEAMIGYDSSKSDVAIEQNKTRNERDRIGTKPFRLSI